MKEIKLLNCAEEDCCIDNELGAYKVVKKGLDDIVVVRNYKYRELKHSEVVSLNSGEEEYKIVEIENNDIHIVKPLETLVSISKEYSIEVDDLKKINNLDTDRLFIGQILKI